MAAGTEPGRGHAAPAVPGVDVDRVTSWLQDNQVDIVPPLRFELVAGGRSNLTYVVTGRDGQALVLRRPPLRGVLRGAHDMAREHRIISALGPTPVPVPPAVGLCEDEAVTGAPFYVMGFVHGSVLRDAGEAVAIDVATRRRTADSLLDTLVDLHGVDPDAVGLGSLGRKEDYVARQLRTWSRQGEQTGAGGVAALTEAHDRLAARIPPQQRATIVHGDYRLDNVIVAGDGTVAAVVDWELCTLGDPLADLGLLLVYWGEDGDEFTALPRPPSALPGFPRRSELAARYAEASGLDLSELDYYVALGCWKLAVVLQGVHARARAGAYGEAGASFDGLGERVGLLAQAAVEAAGRAGR